MSTQDGTGPGSARALTTPPLLLLLLLLLRLLLLLPLLLLLLLLLLVWAYLLTVKRDTEKNCNQISWNLRSLFGLYC